MVTQVEVARMVGLDVSSVNKILNRKAGPKFRKETVKRVLKAAKELGYVRPEGSKANLVAAVRHLLPREETPEAGAARLGLPIDQVVHLREVLAQAE